MRATSTMKTVDPCDDPEWSALAALGDVFHSPAWLRVLRDSFGVTPVAHILSRDGESGVAGLPLCQIDDLIGRRQVTLPFSDLAGPLGLLASEDWDELLTRVLADDLPFRIRTHEHERFESRGEFERVGHAMWHSVDLTADIESIWDDLKPAARQNIRRARKAGVEVEIFSERSALAHFEDLHLGLRRAKYGMLSQPREFFDALFSEFSNDLAVVLATLNGEPIAGIVLLRWGGRAYYKFNASRVEALNSRANDMAMWEAITFASKVWGCDRLDLGLSDLDQPGLIRYKEKYAGISGDIVTYRSLAADESHLSTEARTLMSGLASAVAAEGTPAEVCRAVSSNIYRYFC